MGLAPSRGVKFSPREGLAVQSTARTRGRMDKLHQLRTTLGTDLARVRMIRLVRDLCPPNCWVGAGFVRSAVWDLQQGRSYSSLPADSDIIWLDETLLDPVIDNLIGVDICRLPPIELVSQEPSANACTQ
ncbi:nucleotidyltransferase family protein [Pseudomonas syringae]|uniref:nucleotidyltransferase family protein n=3 Tax=Pseudomonas TaxID=286 RepID=UPI00287B6C6B|nr:nucleotidyltransferase family protein [Pseudomonas syringae]